MFVKSARTGSPSDGDERVIEIGSPRLNGSRASSVKVRAMATKGRLAVSMMAILRLAEFQVELRFGPRSPTRSAAVKKSGDASAKRETVVPHSAFKMSEQLVFGDQGPSATARRGRMISSCASGLRDRECLCRRTALDEGLRLPPVTINRSLSDHDSDGR